MVIFIGELHFGVQRVVDVDSRVVFLSTPQLIQGVKGALPP